MEDMQALICEAKKRGISIIMDLVLNHTSDQHRWFREALKSRDNARTPMQWSAEPNAGFSDAAPWLPVNPNYTAVNAAAALADPESVFYYYQKLIALRKACPVFRDGRFTLLLPDSEKIFAYTRDTDREHLLVVCNFTPDCVPFARPEAFRQAELLISNDSEPAGVLRPYEAQMFYWEAPDPEKGQALKA